MPAYLRVVLPAAVMTGKTSVGRTTEEEDNDKNVLHSFAQRSGCIRYAVC